MPLKDKKLKNGCIPARRRIASGGKAGSYADARTGGKQAYAALKKAKPPGSKGGWTKSKNICCHKCPNDRSAPNGYVCKNPSHLYWGTKADNTYDQNRGNGWASRNKNEGDSNGEKAFAYEIMVSEDKIRKIIKNILKESLLTESQRKPMSYRTADASDEIGNVDRFDIINSTISLDMEEEDLTNLIKTLNEHSIEPKIVREYQNEITRKFNELIKPTIDDAKEKYKILEAIKKEIIRQKKLIKSNNKIIEDYDNNPDYYDGSSGTLLEKLENSNSAAKEKIRLLEEVKNKQNRMFFDFIYSEYSPKIKSFNNLISLYYDDKNWITDPVEEGEVGNNDIPSGLGVNSKVKIIRIPFMN